MISNSSYDVIVVGAGPAGMAATVAASASGRKVAVIDDNPRPGGQIWKNDSLQSKSLVARDWFKKVQDAEFDIFPSTQVIGSLSDNTILAESPGHARELKYERLILATGARELFLPFPGWTLPNVLGAGGLQSLVKSGLPIAGKSVVVAGSGPLLLAVAATLRSKGANIRFIAEQAPFRQLFPFGIALARQPEKLVQAIQLMTSLRFSNFHTGVWPVAAEGDQVVRSVKLTNGHVTWKIECDYLATGFGLVPNLELPSSLGCILQDGFVKVDASQRTSVDHILAAGEITGIGGLDRSLLEGQIAGLSAVDNQTAAEELASEQPPCQRFSAALTKAYLLRHELRHLAEPETIVCRCEDVSMQAMKAHTSWTEAKLQTRCGMGACQGRICGAASSTLFGWTRTSVRPPVFPSEVGSLAGSVNHFE
jgi:NADPH-dependent 2,4-dienoyl-CoA reductase/sulfur reductase-like enzyme